MSLFQQVQVYSGPNSKAFSAENSGFAYFAGHFSKEATGNW